jgi:hypothetical protein
VGGFAVQAFGLHGTIVALTLAELALGIAMLFMPALHDMNRGEETSVGFASRRG